MDDPSRLDAWLALVRAPRLGPATLRKLLAASAGDDPASLVGRSTAQLRAWGADERTARALSSPDRQLLDNDRRWLSSGADRHLIPLDDARLPALLREIADPPIALFALGDPDLLAVPQIAMVGSRNPTSGGRRTARDFARDLAGAGLGITSGLAEGIDTASHEGALAAEGMTIAVMGTGLDSVYPAANLELARRISREGLLISEMPPDTPPRPGHFPRRNRIIAGLSLGVVVVEAAEKSGSLITARLAADYGREVFAIPGSIHNPMARGCHRLIRQGAKLVETSMDILEELGPLLKECVHSPAPASPETEPPLDGDYQKLLEAMGYDPVSIDALVGACGLTPDEVSSMLLILELSGHVSPVPGGLYARIHP